MQPDGGDETISSSSSLPGHTLDRGRWAEARMALVLAKQCHLVSHENFCNSTSCACNVWLAQRFDLLKTVKLIVGASRSDGPTIASLGNERALRRL